MKPAKLNFVKSNLDYSRLGLVFLATGIAMLTTVYLQYQKVNEQINTLVVQSEKLSHKKPVKNTRSNANLTDGIKRQFVLQNQIQQNLTIPWPALLQALEDTKSDTIRLSDINPNVTARTLSIAGQAPHLEDVLAYVKVLSQQANLSNASLRDHQVIKTEANANVKFEIEATWNQP